MDNASLARTCACVMVSKVGYSLHRYHDFCKDAPESPPNKVMTDCHTVNSYLTAIGPMGVGLEVAPTSLPPKNYWVDCLKPLITQAIERPKSSTHMGGAKKPKKTLSGFPLRLNHVQNSTQSTVIKTHSRNKPFETLIPLIIHPL